MSVSVISHPYAQVAFTNVAEDRMDELEPKFDAMIKGIVEGDDFDLQRMRDISEWQQMQFFLLAANICIAVQSLKDKSLAVLETSASFSVSGAIKDAVYSRSKENWGEIFDDDFDVRILIEKNARLKYAFFAQVLLEKPASYWIDLINTTFSGPRVALRGIPSAEYR